jgi:polyhydroxybutyrate depolymerase
MAQVFVTNGGNNWFRRSDSHVLNQFGFDTTDLMTAFFFDDDWQTAAAQDAGEYAKARTYNLYIPPNYDPETPTPLVMLLHGKTANGASQAYTSDMNQLAAREGFIVIYPDGIDNQWNYGRGWRIYPDLPENEEEFLGGLLDDLELDLNIDTSRVYVGGLSNGGFMTQRLACTMRDRFAAYASVAATAPYGIVEECEGKPTVPLMFIHGTADPSVPWSGTTIEYGVSEIYTTLPMEVTATFWAEHNGCAKTFDTEELPQLGDSPDTITYIFHFEDCPATAPLTIYAVNGGGHLWHGSPVYRDMTDTTLGIPSFDFNASEVIWEFFKAHTLEKSS